MPHEHLPQSLPSRTTTGPSKLHILALRATRLAVRRRDRKSSQSCRIPRIFPVSLFPWQNSPHFCYPRSSVFPSHCLSPRSLYPWPVRELGPKLSFESKCREKLIRDRTKDKISRCAFSTQPLLHLSWILRVDWCSLSHIALWEAWSVWQREDSVGHIGKQRFQQELRVEVERIARKRKWTAPSQCKFVQ